MTIRGQTKLFTKRRKRLGRWRYFVTLLSALIVFCTVYALILPAITMERETLCGMTVHEHTEECFDSGGELICSLTEHRHTEKCYETADEAQAIEETAATEAETVEQPTEQIEEETVAQLAVVPKRVRDYAATGSEITSDSVTYSKQIEKLGGDDDYSYRLHLTVDGTGLEGSTTTTEEGESTGIVLLIDVTKDFIATTSDNQSKLTVIQNIVNNYISQFAVNQRNKISVILVRGEQSGSINSTGTVEVEKAWEGYQPIALSSEQIRFTANFKAGLVKAGQFLSSAGTDKTAVVFITNSNPQFSVNDDGSALPRDREINNETQAKTDILNYLPTFFNTYSETDLYILDVEQASEVHETPKAMGEYIESVDRGGYFTAGSSTELIDSFDEIITTIIPGDTTKELVVTDTLSANVVFADDPDVTAKLTIGSETTDVEITLDSANGTVSYTHPDPIEGPFKLEISFEIKTAEGVFRDTEPYPESGYPDIGDPDTDFPGNSTSSGQAGFYSNASGGFSCTVNTTELSGDFKHPVVQAPEKPQPKTQTVTVVKHWADSLTPSAVQMQLYEQDGSTYSLVTTIDLSEQQDAEGSYTYTFADGETVKELYLVENDIGTLPLYSSEEVTINLGGGEIHAAKLTLNADGEPVVTTVTNWPKTSMPATGGVGTIWLIAGGLLLILIGSGALIYKKRTQ